MSPDSGPGQTLVVKLPIASDTLIANPTLKQAHGKFYLAQQLLMMSTVLNHKSQEISHSEK